MDILKKHEEFEIEVLDSLNSAKLLEGLVFGGGTMMRLCYELNRYSVDLDFWFLKVTDEKKYFSKLKNVFESRYDITDAQLKHHTILMELRSAEYPKRLKIEIRRGIKKCEWREAIAFSRFSTRQVMLKVHTLDETMKNKIEALLDRKEIRDCFDIEFLLRRGVELPDIAAKKADEILKVIGSFKERDFKVTLGSILEAKDRQFYVKNGFDYLRTKIIALKE